VYDGKMWYYASTCDIENIQAKLDELYTYAKYNKDILSLPLVKQFEVNKAEKLIFNENSVRKISIDDKLSILQSLLSYHTKCEYLRQTIAIYLDRNSIYKFVSSSGSDISYDYQNSGVILSGTMTDDKGHKYQASYQKSSVNINDLKDSGKEIIEWNKKQVDYMINSVPADTGDFPVVLSPMVAGVFAHESFGHKSEADFMLADEGMRKEWTIGKKVGSDILSICDCGEICGSGYTPYDNEGTKAKNNYLIKNGVLAGRLHNAASAAYLDEEVTGNARAVNCTFEPIVRMTTTYIKEGKDTFDSLIASIDDGYFIETLKHGSGMSKFTIAPDLAYRIRNGKIAEAVKINVITGNVFETLNLIDGLSDKIEIKSFISGGCGKMEQYPLPVGFGGPYVRVSKMKVQ
jgi:TldD protein